MSACCASSPSDSLGSCEGAGLAKQWLRLGLAGLIASQTMVFSLAVNLSPPEAASRWIIHTVLVISTLAVGLFVGGPLVRAAWRAARAGRIVMEQLFLLGIIGSFTASLLASLTGQGAIYYEVVSILLGIYVLGQLLGEKRQRHVQAASQQWATEYAVSQRLNDDDSVTAVPAASIQVRDRVRVEAGEPITVDGRILRGQAYVSETPLTGELIPVVKREGDLVWAGTQCLDQCLDIEATQAGTNRKLDGLLQEVTSAAQRPSSLQREADRLVAWFLPIVITISLVTFLWWSTQISWDRALFNALAVLLVACPCAMGLATPIALSGALQAFARRGWRLREPEFIERLAQVDTIVFDKTGTLSEERLQLLDFVTVSPRMREEILAAVTRLQSESPHPVAKAFHSAQPLVAPAQFEMRHWKTLPALGIEAELRSTSGDPSWHSYTLGHAQLLTAADAAQIAALRGQLKTATCTHEVWVKIDGQLCGLAQLRETLRATAEETLLRLRQQGVNVVVMTGDTEESVARLDLPTAECSLLPSEKAALVHQRQERGERVLFVGDGVNDAPALSVAHASLAMGHGATLTQEAAQAVMHQTNLDSIPDLMLMARRVVRGIRQNLLLAGLYNLGGILLAASGFLHPIAASILMLVASFTVTTRALRSTTRLDIVPPKKSSADQWAKLFNGSQPRSPLAWTVAVGAVVQIFCLAYLGHNFGATGLLLTIGGFLLGIALWLFWPWLRARPQLQMAVTMLTLGNLGMLLGWWADAGFGPIIRDGVCLCGCSKSSMGAGLFERFSTMHVGMILAGFPLMLWLQDPEQALFRSLSGRWLHALWITVGMGIGMWFAAGVLALLPLIHAQTHFYLTYLGMCTGMMLGMLAFCEIWQRAANYQRRHLSVTVCPQATPYRVNQ